MENFTLTTEQYRIIAKFSWFAKFVANNPNVLDFIIQNRYCTIGDIQVANSKTSQISEFVKCGEFIGAFQTFVVPNFGQKGTVCQVLYQPTESFNNAFSSMLEVYSNTPNEKRNRKR